MKGPLKEKLKEHYSSINLSEEQLRSLQMIGQLSLWDRIIKHSSSLRGMAVILVIGLVATTYLWKSSVPPMNLTTLPEEIAYHHNKHMKSEIQTHSMDELKSFLTKLDFSLIDSERLPSSEWELLGGRYCSLQGRLAAQIKVRNKKNNKEYTLYQLAIPKELTDLNGVHEDYRLGAKVKIWKERGLLLGIAGNE
jgi:hypothetical protein